MTTSLDYLKQTGTVVVSDSGDFECKLSFRRHVDAHIARILMSLPCLAIDVYKPQVSLLVNEYVGFVDRSLIS